MPPKIIQNSSYLTWKYEILFMQLVDLFVRSSIVVMLALDGIEKLTCCTELHVFDLDRSEFWGLKPLVLILFGVSFCVSFCILIELCKSESFLKLAWKYNSFLHLATVLSCRATSTNKTLSIHYIYILTCLATPPPLHEE